MHNPPSLTTWPWCSTGADKVPSVSIRRTQPTADEIKWMARAVDLAERCVTESGRPQPSPKVGAVAVAASGAFLGEAHRGQLNQGDHAEYCLISSLGVETGVLAGATVYTTLEPCTTRNPPKIPCAERMIAEQVRVVYVGMLDPDARIRELGCKALREAGIDVRDFTAELRDRVHSLNQPFVDRSASPRDAEAQQRSTTCRTTVASASRAAMGSHSRLDGRWRERDQSMPTPLRRGASQARTPHETLKT